MNIELPLSWKKVLAEEIEKSYYTELISTLGKQYQYNQCYPPVPQIFSAFEFCSFNDVKVVIIGQDPYHGPNQAHGLCFSVNDGVAFPPSLRNIFEEIKRDLHVEVPKSGNLERWARQGVLMLNATLTVGQGAAGSHQKFGWEKFTDAVIQTVSEKKENVVFLLWGAFAKKKGSRIDKSKHLVLEAGHPSPMSANNGHWFGNKHFSKTNEYLESKNLNPIKW